MLANKDIDYTKLDADKVLIAFGKYGKYQMMTYALTNLIWITFATEMMISAFIASPPPFECTIDPGSQQVSPLIRENLAHFVSYCYCLL